MDLEPPNLPHSQPSAEVQKGSSWRRGNKPRDLSDIPFFQEHPALSEKLRPLCNANLAELIRVYARHVDKSKESAKSELLLLMTSSALGHKSGAARVLAIKDAAIALCQIAHIEVALAFPRETEILANDQKQRANAAQVLAIMRLERKRQQVFERAEKRKKIIEEMRAMPADEGRELALCPFFTDPDHAELLGVIKSRGLKTERALIFALYPRRYRSLSTKKTVARLLDNDFVRVTTLKNKKTQLVLTTSAKDLARLCGLNLATAYPDFTPNMTVWNKIVARPVLVKNEALDTLPFFKAHPALLAALVLKGFTSIEAIGFALYPPHNDARISTRHQNLRLKFRDLSHRQLALEGYRNRAPALSKAFIALAKLAALDERQAFPEEMKRIELYAQNLEDRLRRRSTLQRTSITPLKETILFSKGQHASLLKSLENAGFDSVDMLAAMVYPTSYSYNARTEMRPFFNGHIIRYASQESRRQSRFTQVALKVAGLVKMAPELCYPEEARLIAEMNAKKVAQSMRILAPLKRSDKLPDVSPTVVDAVGTIFHHEAAVATRHVPTSQPEVRSPQTNTLQKIDMVAIFRHALAEAFPTADGGEPVTKTLAVSDGQPHPSLSVLLQGKPRRQPRQVTF